MSGRKDLDVPTENLVAMFEAAKEFSVYPPRFPK